MRIVAGTLAGVLVPILLGSGGPATAQTPHEEQPAVRSLFIAGRVEVEGGAVYSYRLLSPPGDAAAPEGGWPLVVFLHGAGERGDDNEAQLAHFPERMAGREYRERFPCYLLAVQCPAEERWTLVDWSGVEAEPMGAAPGPPVRAVMLAIEQVVGAEPVDLRRIYLTGLSMGGFGSWELAARKPEWFAAVAPVCGGGDPESAGAYAGLPIWAWHDRDDPVVPVERTRVMVEAAKMAGAVVRYDEVTGDGHASWVPAYEADHVPAWMFEQRRKEASGDLVALRERTGTDE